MPINFDEIINRRETESVKWATGLVFGDPQILPLWVADMDFKAPPAVLEALAQRVSHGVFGYVATPPSLYQAVGAWLSRRHDWEVHKEWVSITPGVVPAINLAIQAFTQPGDKIIVQPPVYYPFFSAVKNNGRYLIENHLVEENGTYRMDFEALEQQMSDRRARMLILCSPHNPVGRVWQRDELEQLSELCLKHQVLLVSDEIHHDLVFAPHRHTPTAALAPEIAANTITLIAPSKTFNLAGLHTSLAVIPNDDLRSRFSAQLEAVGVGHSTIFGALALETAYAHGEAWLGELLVYLQGNAEMLSAFLAQRLPQVKARPPEGTYLAWLDFRALRLSQAQLNELLLKRAKVGMNDGEMFGAGGVGFQRLNFGCPRALLRQALEQIAAVM